jgi:hypothetical protein
VGASENDTFSTNPLVLNVDHSRHTVWCWQIWKSTKLIGNKVPIIAHACTTLSWYNIHTAVLVKWKGKFVYSECSLPALLNPPGPLKDVLYTSVSCNLFATSTGMTSFLGHEVLTACTEVKHQQCMNTWPYIAVPTDYFISGQWYTHTHFSDYSNILTTNPLSTKPWQWKPGPRGCFVVFMALWPNAGHCLLVHKVSWSHTMTHHSR